MSPAGIPMFYAAMDEDTAILETYDPDQRKERDVSITLARFETSKQLTLLDLKKLPQRPSCYDSEHRHTIKKIEFLWSLRDELTKSIKKDGREHVEYVPTQVITEYVRHRLTYGERKKTRIDGIIYPSARNGGSTAVVIFADSEHCGPGLSQINIDSSEPPRSPKIDSRVFLHLIKVKRVMPPV